jgi:hypothetical protein
MAFGTTPISAYRPSLRDSRDEIEPGVAMDGMQTEGFTPLSSMHHIHMSGIPFLRQTPGIPSLPMPLAVSAFQTTASVSRPQREEDTIEDEKDDEERKIQPSAGSDGKGGSSDHVEIGRKRSSPEKDDSEEVMQREDGGASLRKRRKGLRRLSIRVETVTQEKYVTARFENSLESKEGQRNPPEEICGVVNDGDDPGGGGRTREEREELEERDGEEGREGGDSGAHLSPTEGAFASTRFKDFLNQQYFGKALGSKDVSTPYARLFLSLCWLHWLHW